MNLEKGEEYRSVIGIDFGEKHRAARWLNDANVVYPLIEKQINREGCVKLIEGLGWKVPIKSGCYFCPFAPVTEFAELKLMHPELFNRVCELEKKVLSRLTKSRLRGWFNDKYLLAELVERKVPESVEGQCGLMTKCVYCFG
jgi:hypothetical protein